MTKIAGSGSISPADPGIRIHTKMSRIRNTAFCSHPEAEDLIVRPVTAGAAELSLDAWGDACRGRNRN
jgi:hypothetical protein